MVPPRTFATKILPNFWVNFQARFASKPLVVLGSALVLFRTFFGAVRAILWRWGSFLSLELGPWFERSLFLCSAVWKGFVSGWMGAPLQFFATLFSSPPSSPSLIVLASWVSCAITVIEETHGGTPPAALLFA